MISITIDNVTPLQMRQISDIMNGTQHTSNTPTSHQLEKELLSLTKAFPGLPTVPSTLEPETIVLEDIEPTAPSTPADYSTNEVPTPVTVPVESNPAPPTATRKKGGKSGPKMATFGRTPEQIKSFADAEANRTKDLDEEEEIRNQRREEREAAKAVKDQELAEKAKAKELEDNLIAEIKAADEAPKALTATVRKPWVL